MSLNWEDHDSPYEMDPYELHDSPREFFTYGEPCENCGAACDSGTRVWVPGFEYWACDQCAEECRIVIFAEENCSSLYRAIMRAKTVSGVSQAFRWHKASCPKCNPKIAPLPARKKDGTEPRRERAA